MASAAATDGTSRATISRSRADNATLSSSYHQLRHFHQPFELRAKQVGHAGIGNIIHFVKSAVRTLDRYLFGYHQCPAAKFENLAQCHQRAQATGPSRRGRSDCEHAPLEGGIGRIPTLAHARYPIDSV